MYTSKHTQWFYFRVRGTKAGVTYRFTIVNLMKGRSLYSQGMRPLLYSQRAAGEKGVGWHRIGSDIKYYRNYAQVGRFTSGHKSPHVNVMGGGATVVREVERLAGNWKVAGSIPGSS